MTTGTTERFAMTDPGRRTLILCGGLQSSGTTLISYCFLQRADTNGVLDADNDLLPEIDERLATPVAWYKTTICCFRLSEIAQYYRDSGWDVRTLLVLRDLRSVWASLRNKPYGRNGITAEDPPLRLRIRRFVEDWREMHRTGGAMLRYEDFIATPTTTLQQSCADLRLDWDVSMLTWPKAPDRIADHRNGNESFWVHRGANLMSSLAGFEQHRGGPEVPRADLHWLESQFQDFNEANGYPVALPPSAADDRSLNNGLASEPSFGVTRRYKWETTHRPIRWLLDQLGRPNTKLIERRSRKRAA